MRLSSANALKAIFAGHIFFAIAAFGPLVAAAATTNPCAELPAGSVVASPPQLTSTNGQLEVNFSFETGVDANGLTRYCYINPDTGDQAPTLRVNAGDQLIIHFTNDIPAAAAAQAAAMPGMVMKADASPATTADTLCNATTLNSTSTNMHFHGMNVSPACHQDEVLHTIVNPGQEFDYSVQIPANEPSGMYWYHPHPHGFSDPQLLGGASGIIIVDGIENFNSAVAGLPERILVIRDQPLQSAEVGQTGAPAHDLSLNTIPVIFPNYEPSVIKTPASTTSTPVKEFWRVANTSADTLVNLQYIVNGVAQTVEVIAVDGVPLTDGSGNPTSTSTTSVLLPTGSRAEFILTTPQAGQTAQLYAQAWNNGSGFDYDPARPLATIIGKASTSDSGLPITSTVKTIPAVTRSLPQLRFSALNTATATVERNLYFSVNLSTSPPQFYLTVAGQTPAVFNMDGPPSIVTRSGSVEQWTIQNQAPMDHAFHIHQIHFRTLAINGTPVTDYTERDTIDIPHWTGSGAYPSVTLLMDFTDPGIVGTFVYHCHVLSHEDLGMMGSIQVLPPLIDSTTTLAASPKAATSGQSVTLTATVAASASGSTSTPTGTVTFTNGTTTLGTGTLNSSGVARLATKTLPNGSDPITAAYGGDTNFAPSTSSAVTVTVTGGPKISTISHNYGAPKAVETISGKRFGATQGTSTVRFNGTAATPTAWSATSITVPVPAGASTGNVVVTVGGEPSNGVAFSVYPDPVITGISPASGPVGTTITVAGANLKDPENEGVVYFDGDKITPTSLTSTAVQIVVPTGATSSKIAVFSSGVSASSPMFTVTSGPVPSISSISHTYGAPGAVETITGTNFGAKQGTSTVTFNGTAATPTAWSATSLTLPVPTGASTGNVVVTVGTEASNGIAFSVYPDPVITSISPTSGPVGTVITVTGTNLLDPDKNGAVYFDSAAVTPISLTSTKAQLTVPSGGTSSQVAIYSSGVVAFSPVFTVTTPAAVKNTDRPR